MSTLVASTIQDRVSSDSKSVVDLFTGWTKIATRTASASTTLDFDSSDITSTYDKYCFVLENIRPTTDAVDFAARISQGSGFLSDSNYWYHSVISQASASTYNGTNSAAANRMSMAGSIGNDAVATVDGCVYLTNPASAAAVTTLYWLGAYYVSSSTLGTMHGAGAYTTATTACDGVRFLMSSGTIADGSITLYGIA